MPQAVQHMEKARRRRTVAEIGEIARALGVTTGSLRELLLAHLRLLAKGTDPSAEPFVDGTLLVRHN